MFLHKDVIPYLGINAEFLTSNTSYDLPKNIDGLLLVIYLCRCSEILYNLQKIISPCYDYITT